METKSRRAARETALNVLYQVDVAKLPPKEALSIALENTNLSISAAEFATQLVEGTIASMNELDANLSQFTVGWDLMRQPAIDRNILRMAMYEIMYLENIPNSVSINEAVDLAKKFSTGESGKFINGVLGALVRNISFMEDNT